MASHDLIDAYLDQLRRRLPTDAADELADGLAETYRVHRDRHGDPGAAARAALAEFGDLDQVSAAFARHAPGRRVALALLATGPLFGASWGACVIVGRAWTWPIPAAVGVAVGLALVAVVTTLVLAATGGTYRRTRLAVLGGTGVIALDLLMLCALALAAPTWVWPMAAAVPASLARLGLTLRALPRVLAG